MVDGMGDFLWVMGGSCQRTTAQACRRLRRESLESRSCFAPDVWESKQQPRDRASRVGGAVVGWPDMAKGRSKDA